MYTCNILTTVQPEVLANFIFGSTKISCLKLDGFYGTQLLIYRNVFEKINFDGAKTNRQITNLVYQDNDHPVFVHGLYNFMRAIFACNL